MSMLTLVPGLVVSVQSGLIEHPGIYTDQGTVIASSFKARRVIELPVADFAEGKTLKCLGYPGNRPPAEVIAAARAELGRAWTLFTNNCEHFVTRAHGLSPRSRQLETAVAIGFLILAAGLSSRVTA